MKKSLFIFGLSKSRHDVGFHAKTDVEQISRNMIYFHLKNEWSRVFRFWKKKKLIVQQSSDTKYLFVEKMGFSLLCYTKLVHQRTAFAGPFQVTISYLVIWENMFGPNSRIPYLIVSLLLYIIFYIWVLIDDKYTCFIILLKAVLQWLFMLQCWFMWSFL